MRFFNKKRARSDAKPASTFADRALPCAAPGKMCPLRFWNRNQKLAHLFMICSNIKLRRPRESIEIEGDSVIASEAKAIQQHRQRLDCFVASAPRNDE
jgi:hypothetical protein